MAIFRQTGSINANYRLELEVWTASQNIAGNFSDVGWSCRLVHIGTAWSFSNIGMTISVHIHGRTQVLLNTQQRSLSVRRNNMVWKWNT